MSLLVYVFLIGLLALGFASLFLVWILLREIPRLTRSLAGLVDAIASRIRRS